MVKIEILAVGSQNYLISAPAPAPPFPLFWLCLRLQFRPYIGILQTDDIKVKYLLKR